MMTGSQILQDRVSAGATARLDRGFTEPEYAEKSLENWLHQVAGENLPRRQPAHPRRF